MGGHWVVRCLSRTIPGFHFFWSWCYLSFSYILLQVLLTTSFCKFSNFFFFFRHKRPRCGSCIDRLGRGLCQNPSLFDADFLVAWRSPSSPPRCKRFCHAIDRYSILDRGKRCGRLLPGPGRPNGTSRSGDCYPCRAMGCHLRLVGARSKEIGAGSFAGIVEEKETRERCCQ